MGKFKPKCRTCGEINNVNFYYWLLSQCKECRKKYMKEYFRKYGRRK